MAAEKGSILSDYTKNPTLDDLEEFQDPEDLDTLDLEEDMEDEDGEGGPLHKEVFLPEGMEMPPYPQWSEDGTLMVPPRWKGELSDIQFYVKHQPNGTLLFADIPGEVESTVSAFCTCGEGLLSTVFAIDAAISVASEPEDVPVEFLAENSMALHAAAMIFDQSSTKIRESMSEAFRSPDQAKEFDAQKKMSDQVADSLQQIAQRIRGNLAAKIDPLLNAASLEVAQGRHTQH